MGIIPELWKTLSTDQVVYNFGNLSGQVRGHGISHLYILLRSISFKAVVVRKSLNSGRLTYSQRSALGRVIVDEVVSVL